MKPILLLPFILCSQLLLAQTFTEKLLGTPFEGLYFNSIAFSDVNGDGAPDILITGDSCISRAILYTNDGGGHFFEVPDTPFEGVSSGSIAFSDVNGDGSSDVLITGWNNSHERITKLYLNDGAGNFSEMPDTPFEGVSNSSVAFSDVNGDGTSDVLITGGNNSGDRIAKLYLNDGDGNFSEMTDTLFEGVSGSSVAFSDVNGDGAADVLITGGNNSGDRIAKLYTNEGDGNFSEMPNTPFEGVVGSSVAFSDVNGDGAADVLITGGNNSGRIAKLYINEGDGNFFEMPDTPFEGVSGGSVAFSDVNGDGNPDVLITGDVGTGVPITKLYTSDDDGNFSEMPGTLFEGVSYGSVAFSDVNGDGAPDVFVIGATHNWVFYANPIAKLYTNDGAGNFTTSYVEGVSYGSIAFSDVNGDGFSDVLITGEKTIWKAPIAILYTNDGTGNFSEMQGTPFEGVSGSSIAFSDVNGDGNPDVLITGWNNSGDRIAKLYINDGTGSFFEMPDTPFEGVSGSSIAFSDVNGDGNPDVLITGWNNSGYRIAKLYLNGGDGDFSEVPNTPFEGVSYGSIAFSDVNGDGAPDVLITGMDSLETPIAKLYTNDDDGVFSEVPDTPFEGVSNGSIAFSDVNGDGAPDVLITGLNDLGDGIAKLYLNDGNGDFSEMPDTPFEGVEVSSIAFSDVNGDGAPDVLITGWNGNLYGGIAKLYLNNGNGSFSEVPDTPFVGVSGGSVAFSDVNGDGAPDVFITGDECWFILTSKLYINDSMFSSTSKWEAEENPFALIYPNPNTTDKFFIDYESAEHSELQISLYDLSGRLLQQFKRDVSIGLNSIPFESLTLPRGMYFFKLEDGIYITTLKLIIQ